MLVLLEEPNEWQPVYNNIIYRYSSDLITQTNFEYMIQIEVSSMGSGGTFSAWEQIAEISQPPRPDGTCQFDIHKYLSNELSENFNPNKKDQVVSILDASNIHTKYRVVPFETYNSNFIWEFNTIDKYLDNGIDRPAFKALAPLTTPTDLGDYQDTLAIVSMDNGNPFGEIWDGISFKIYNDYDLGFTLKFQDATWNNSLLSTLTESGTIELVSEVVVQTEGTTTNSKNTWNGIFDFHNYNNFIVAPGSSTQSSDINYEFNEVLSDTYFARLNATIEQDYNFISTIPSDGFGLLEQDYMWLNTNVGTASTVLKISSNNGLYTFDLDNETNISDVRETISTIGVGPQNLILGTSSATVIAGTLPIIDNSIEKYSFWLSDSTIGNDPYMSKVYTININNPCTKYDKYSILYLDPLGSFIPVNFYLVKRDNIKIKRTNYNKNYGNTRTDWNGNSRWGFDTWDRGNKNIDTTYTETFTMTSDWLNNIQNDRMQEMLLSPSTYLIDNIGTFTAINITTSAFEKKKIINDQIINYTIKFEYSQQNRTNI